MKTSHKLLLGLLLAAVTTGCCYWAYYTFDPGTVRDMLVYAIAFLVIALMGSIILIICDSKWFFTYLVLSIIAGIFIVLIQTSEEYGKTELIDDTEIIRVEKVD